MPLYRRVSKLALLKRRSPMCCPKPPPPKKGLLLGTGSLPVPSFRGNRWPHFSSTLSPLQDSSEGEDVVSHDLPALQEHPVLVDAGGGGPTECMW